MEHPNLAKEYRRDIDGLRAVAVLLVVFYHIGVKFVQAGFLGVDIFFVISGFLITDHICRDIKKGRFTLKQFYIRRMRRILPALIVVLFFTTIAAYFFLFPSDLKNYSDSLIAVILSVSNFYFWHSIHLGYFSTDASIIPLLHTWSLGVEEQFYLVWPFLLVVLFRIFTNRAYILFTIVLLTLCSLTTYHLLRNNILLTYYSPMTRGFELFFGALLAFNYHKFGPVKKNKLLLHLFSIIGLGLVLYGGFILTEKNYHHGYNILIPTLGTLVLIYTGKSDGIANKILSFRPLVFIGLISYSLYLWHWPMIAFVNYFGVPLNFVTQSCIVISSILLSFLTWKFVEQPFRHKIIFNFRKTVALIWAPSFLAAIIFFVPIQSISNFGFNRIPTQVKKVLDNQNFGPINPDEACHVILDPPTHLGSQDGCAIGNIKLERAQVLLTGDSHALAANGMINFLLKDANLRGYIATEAGIPFILTDPENPHLLNKAILMRNSVIEKLIKKYHYKYVVMGGAWSIYGFKSKKVKNSMDGFKIALTNAVKFVIKNKSIPVIILDVPPLSSLPVTCGEGRISFGKCYNSINKVKKIQAQTRQVILEVKKQFPQVILIDPSKIICQNNKCYSLLNGTPLYFTGQLNSHLNYAGSTLIGERYLKKYGNPFGRHYHFHAESYLNAHA